MSKTIDEKVVQLEFDNTDFEKNVNKSMTTLEKFKSALQFKGASKGIEEVEEAAENCNLESLSTKTDLVSKSFSALEKIATGALYNIGQKISETGTNLIKSMSGIANITAGFQKYEEQMVSIQTVMSAVSSKINEATGELYSLDDVSDTISKLGWYTDETSYNMEQMTNSIGSFTSAGVDLKVAEKAVIGIANASALAGVNSQKAQFAFTGFEKAISSGYVSLGLWNQQLKTSGITNSERFKQSVLDAAVAVGTLTKKSNGLYKTTKKAFKSGESVSIQDFTSALTETQWLSTDVLMKVFETYASGLDDVYESYERLSAEGVTTSEIIEQLKEELEASGKEIPLWLESFEAAQVAVTFTQAMDSVKTAVQSGWKNTFEILFGNLNEAKSLWTDLANNMYEIFAEGSNTRNSILSEAFDSKWRDFEDTIKNAGGSLDGLTESLNALYLADETNLETVIKDFDSLEDAIAEGAVSSEYLTTGLTNYIETLMSSTEATDEQRRSLQYLYKQVLTGRGDITNILKSITKVSGRNLLAKSIINLTEIVINLKNAVSDAWSDVFNINYSEVIYSIIEKIYNATEAIKNFTAESTTIQGLMKTIFSVLQLLGKGFKLVYTVVKQLAESAFKILGSVLGDVNLDFSDFVEVLSGGLDKLIEWVEESGAVSTAVETMATAIKDAFNTVKDWVTNFISSDQITDFVTAFTNTFSTGSSSVKSFFKDLTSGKIKDFSTLLSNIKDNFKGVEESAKKVKDVLGDAWDSVTGKLEGSSEVLEEVAQKIQTFVETLLGLGAGYMVLNTLDKIASAIKNVTTPLELFENLIRSFTGVGNALTNYINTLQQNVSTNNILKIAIAIGILATSMFILAKIDSNALWQAIGATATLVVLIGVLSWVVTQMKTVEGQSVSIKEVAALVLSLAAALLILSFALEKMDNLRNGLESAIIVAGLLVVLAKAASMIKKTGGKETAGQLIAFAASIYILASALKNLASLNFEEIKNAIYGMAACLGALWVATKVSTKLGGNNMWSLLALSGSLYLLTISFSRFSKIDAKKYYKGLITLLPLLVILGAILKAASFSGGGSAAGVAAMTVAVAGAVYLMARSIERLGTIDTKVLIKGGLAASVLFAVIGGMAAGLSILSKKMGGVRQAISMSIMVLALAASVYLMVGAVLIFKNIKSEDLWKAVGVIAVLEIALGAMVALMYATKFSSSNFKQLSKLALVIAVLAISIVALSMIQDTTKLYSAVGSLVAVIGMLALLALALSKIDNTKDVMGACLILTLMLAAVGGVMYLLIKYTDDANKATKILESFGTFMLKLGAVSVLMAVAASTLNGVSLAAIGKLAAIEGIILVMGGIFGALGTFVNWLNNEKGVDFIAGLETATTVVTKVGELVGGFFGALVGNFLGEAMGTFMDDMPAVGSSLGEFATNAEPFFKLEIPETFTTSIGMIEDLITTFGSTKFLKNLDTIKEKEETIKGSASFFEEFGKIIVGFSDVLVAGKIDAAAVSAAASAGTMIGEIMDAIPKEGGFLSTLFGGEQMSLSDFGEQMVSFATSLTRMSDRLRYFDPNTATLAHDAGMSMTELANALPSEGSTVSKWLVGEQNLSVFGENIVSFAGSLVAMADILANGTEEHPGKFNDQAPGIAKKAGETMVELANTIPETGSLKTLIFGGNKSLGVFGNNIETFVNALVLMSDSLCGENGFNTDAPDIAKKAGETMSELNESIPETGSLKTLIMGGNKNLGTFGENITAYVRSLVKMSNALTGDDEEGKGFNSDAIDIAYNAGLMLAEIANAIPESGGLYSLVHGGSKDLKSFGSDAVKLAEGLVDVSQVITKASKKKNGFNENTIEMAANIGKVFTSLYDALPTTKETDSFNLSSFGKGLGPLANGLKKFYNTMTEVKVDKLTSGTISNIATLMTTLTSVFALDEDFDEHMYRLTEFGDSLPRVGNGFKNLFTAFSDTNVKSDTITDIMTLINDILALFNDGGITADKNKLLESFGKVIADLGTELATFITSLTQTGMDALTKFNAGLSDSNSTYAILNTVKKLIESIEEEMDFKDDAIGLGKSALEGLYEGLSDSDLIAALYAKAAEIANTIATTMNSCLDVNSPSKVTMKIGEYVDLGLIAGMSNLENAVYDEADSIGNTLQLGLSSAIQAANSILDEDLNPVITPVLDLSNVQANAGSISSLLGARQSYNLAIQNGGKSLALAGGIGSIQSGKAVTLNATFNVNANKEITRTDVQKWSSWLVDEINDSLGRQIR